MGILLHGIGVHILLQRVGDLAHHVGLLLVGIVLLLLVGVVLLLLVTVALLLISVVLLFVGVVLFLTWSLPSFLLRWSSSSSSLA